MLIIYKSATICSRAGPSCCDSNEYTRYTVFNIKENQPKLSQICRYGIFLQGTPERVRNSRGKRAISVRATEVLLYIVPHSIDTQSLAEDTHRFIKNLKGT